MVIKINIEKKIKKIVTKHQTNNPIELAERLGFIVLFENLGTINGYYNVSSRQKIIHINENLPRHIQLLTVAHELGHGILHNKINTAFLKEHTFLSVNKLEKEANLFAIHLLISDEELEELSHYTISQLSKHFGYPEPLISLRLLNKTST
ncbi:MAG: ImmA/IrrE family metallo-endopeptidase [Lachnospirales bacterium]